jgi:hypothetical protein
MVNTMPQLLYHRELPGTHRVGVRLGPRVSLDGCKRISLSSAFDPHTIQPVASCSIDYTIPAHMYFCTKVHSVIYQRTANVFRPLRSSSVGDRLGPRVSLDGRRKISLSSAFDPQTIQLVASCSTDYTIPAHIYFCAKVNSVMYQKTAIVFRPL